MFKMMTRGAIETDTVEDLGRVGQTRVVLGAAFGLAGGFAPLYFGTLSVFLKPVSQAFDWGRGQTSAVTVLAMLGLALGAPLAGRLIDRFGAARVIPASVALFVAALLTLPMLPGMPAAFAVISLLTGVIAAGTTPAGYLSVLPRHFDKRLGLALGVAMAGLGLGAVLAPIVAQAWISAQGWQGAYRSLALTALCAGGLAWVLLFSRRDSSSASRPSHQCDRDAAKTGDTLGVNLRTTRFWLVALALFLVSAAGLGATVHVASMFSDRGIAADIAARAVAISGLGVMIGRIAAGALMDKIHAPWVAAVSFVLGAAGLLVIASNPGKSFPILALGALLFSFTIGAEGDLIPFLVRRYFGLRAFGSTLGVLYCVFGLGGLCGPVLFGVSFDRLGSYTPALLTAAGACLAGSIAILGLGPYRFASAGA